jgi:hypothetical protein
MNTIIHEITRKITKETKKNLENVFYDNFVSLFFP